MHLAQKRAIFGMVDAIESQLRYLKSIILMDEQESVDARHMPRGISTGLDERGRTASDQYLSIKEEKELAERMEAARLEGVAEESDIRAAWQQQNQELENDGHGVMF